MFFEMLKVQSIVVRAVGPIERIYGWIRGCSTWNTLVLLKGPGWDEEWATFQAGKHHRELEIERQFGYNIGLNRNAAKFYE